jgi:hypothetical protein
MAKQIAPLIFWKIVNKIKKCYNIKLLFTSVAPYVGILDFDAVLYLPNGYIFSGKIGDLLLQFQACYRKVWVPITSTLDVDTRPTTNFQ